MPKIFLTITFFIFGTIIGSFLNVLIFRIFSGDYLGIIKGRSECNSCKQRLKAKELIPLLSYVWLKAKCKNCKQKISLTYFITELLCGLSFMTAFLYFPQAFDSYSNSIYFILILYYLSVLVFTTIYDLLYFEISDLILLPAIAVAFLALLHPLSPEFKSGVLGALLIFSFFYLQILVSKGRWLGGGDLRIGVFMGLILGFQNSIVALASAYFLGSIISLILISSSKLKLKSEIPFAPFLCLGTIIAFYHGEQIVNWYINLLGINSL